MEIPRQLIFLTLSCIVLLCATAYQTPKAYIVYMGSSTNVDRGVIQMVHLQMLSSIIPREESERLSLIHSYHHAFMGFTAMLTDTEASVLSGFNGIVSVFEDPILDLHTTRSWDFLKAQSIRRSSKHKHKYPRVSDDVIIGIIDTGIWPESPSFHDIGMSEIPSRWRGICMEGSNFKKSNCNRKLIGARYYGGQDLDGQSMKDLRSPRDSVGHGTHTASTAAGGVVHNASYYGLAQGTARGGSPSSRIASYKACSVGGCTGSTLLKAIDDAIADGVDIISVSVGLSAFFDRDYLNDPIAIGAFHAMQAGIMVFCSGGNEGPEPYTVVNTAPWIFTVAASTIDRDFQSTVILGNGAEFKGSSINFSNLTRSHSFPLVFGGGVALDPTHVTKASNCYPETLDVEKTAGKIIVCTDTDSTVSRRVKVLSAKAAQAKGLIVIDDMKKEVPFESDLFPFSQLSFINGNQILNYINSTKNPTATILPTVVASRFRPAPVIPYFSSRGPGAITETILKPDVTAPGVGILASWIPATDNLPVGQKPSIFALKSGTSMACPHATGAAAFLKSVHPNWTPSMIKSALMTTATSMSNIRKPITNSSDEYASPHEMGTGEISPFRALSPGLVYETTAEDYLYFLCYYGYKEDIIQNISGINFSCPSKSKEELISNLNYPSISIPKLIRRGSPVTVIRTVTNVGPSNSVYVAMNDAPAGLNVKVSPERLVFSEQLMRASFLVKFSGEGAKGYKYGSVTWSDGVHHVRTVYAVNVV